MRDLQEQIAEGKRRYGIDLRNSQQLPKDRPPTEDEIRRYHAERHSGPFMKCEKCERILGGEMENAQTVKCPYPGCKREIDLDKLYRHLMGAHGESGEMALARQRGLEDPDFGTY